MDQYKDDDMAYNFAKYKEENRVVKCIDKPSILKLVGDLNGKSVIDYGCGSGFHTRLFSKAGAKKIIGIDYSQHMIDLAKRLDAEAGIEGLEYHVGNCAEDLNLGEHDLVFSSFFLVHATDRNLLQKFINSMFNSAKPGAICCGITYNAFLKTEDFPFLLKYGYDISLNDNPQEGDIRTIKYAAFTIKDNYMPPKTTEEAFKNAGFVNFRWQNTCLDSEYAQEAEFLADYLAHPNGIMYYCEKPLSI